MTSVDTDKLCAVLEPKTSVETAKNDRKPGDLKPCERCRSQHLKCIYDSEKCRRCEHSGVECVRNVRKIRFRGVQISKLRGERKKSNANASKNGRTAVRTSKTQPHNKEPEGQEPSTRNPLPEQSVPDDDRAATAEAVAELTWQDSATSIVTGGLDGISQAPFQTTLHDGSIFGENGTMMSNFISPPPLPPLPPGSTSSRQEDMSLGSLKPARTFSSDAVSTVLSFSPSQRSSIRSTQLGLLDQLVKYPIRGTQRSSLDYLETVLLRYFHDELAPWFDLCDPDCHFAFVVPNKAREPGPLRNALLTISARSLSRNTRFRNAAGVVEWAGCRLPELREELAMTYHNDCIRDLLQMSMDPEKLHDDTLLAAVITLRTDEELSSNTLNEEDEDQQLFLRIASVFINAQVPASICLPHSSPEVFPAFVDPSHNDLPFQVSPRLHSNMTSPSNHTDTDLGASGLRQACFWTAFRQELHASFLRQQEVRFPLARCEAFRQLTPAVDAVWTNRMVTFCADVLEFCYGSSCSDGNVPPAYTNQGRWMELRNHERNLCEMLPASFEPTFCRESNATQGVIFPEIWYLESCHVGGTTYIELARVLLEAFNPTRPKLGHGFLAATNAFIASTKKTLFRLCGIALSNHRFCPPSLINACLGISMFGEYFEDPVEQEALLGLLSLMSSRHAYPTHKIANSLRRAWSADETYSDRVN